MAHLLAHWVILRATACDSLSAPKITITFTEDENCTVEGATSIPAGKNIPVDVIGNLKTPDTVGIGITRIAADKTPEDLLEAEEDRPFGPQPGQVEGPSKDGKEMPVSPEQAGWLLEAY